VDKIVLYVQVYAVSHVNIEVPDSIAIAAKQILHVIFLVGDRGTRWLVLVLLVHQIGFLFKTDSIHFR
jgi:hypothetical protein